MPGQHIEITPDLVERYVKGRPEGQKAALARLDEVSAAALSDAAAQYKTKTAPAADVNAIMDPAISPGESAFRGAAKKGLFEFGDELAGATNAVTQKAYGAFHPDMPAQSWSELYNEGKQDWQGRDAAAERVNPKSFLGGEGAGVLASAMVPGLNFGAGVEGGALTGAAQGGLSALGAGEGSAAEQTKQGLTGAAFGGAFGAGGELLTKGAGALASRISDSAAMQAFRAGFPKLRDLKNFSKDEMLAVGRRLLGEKDVHLLGRNSAEIAASIAPVKREVGEEIGGILDTAQEGLEGQGIPIDRTEVANQIKAGAGKRYRTSATADDRAFVEGKANDLAEHYAQPSQEPMSVRAIHSEKKDFSDKARFDNPAVPGQAGAYRGISHDLREILASKVEQGAPESYQRFLAANKRYEELAPVEKMAAESSLREMAAKYGIPAADLLIGLGTWGATDSPHKAIPAAVITHLLLTRGRGTAAVGSQVLSHVFDLAAKAGGKIPAGLYGQMGAQAEESQLIEEMMKEKR